MNQDKMKQKVAEAALKYVEQDMIVGVGTGSTVNYFIESLATMKSLIEGAVASSVATEKRLKQLGIPVIHLNSAGDIPIYIDGADEVNQHKQLIKGGGGALVREKIVAAAANKFVCIVDQSKQVDLLGEFPVAVEVIPMARSYVARQLVKMGSDPVYRENFVSDNGNIILDVHNLKLLDPVALEAEINSIAGVVDNGIFAKNTADILLVGTEDSVITL